MQNDEYAILNWYDNPNLWDMETRYVGDIVTSRESGFNLTKGKRYKIVAINSIVDITVKNDKGIEDIYAVGYFY